MKLHFIYLSMITAIALSYTPNIYAQSKPNKPVANKTVNKPSNSSLNLKYKCKDKDDNINYRAEKEKDEECWLMTMSEIKKLEIASTPVNPKEQFSAPKYVWVKDRFYVGDEVVTKDQTPPDASAFNTIMRTGIRISLNPEDKKQTNNTTTKVRGSNKNDSTENIKLSAKPPVTNANIKPNSNKIDNKNMASLNTSKIKSEKIEDKKEIKLSNTIQEQLNVMRKGADNENITSNAPRILAKVPSVKPILEEEKPQISITSQRVAITPEDFLLNK